RVVSNEHQSVDPLMMLTRVISNEFRQVLHQLLDLIDSALGDLDEESHIDVEPEVGRRPMLITYGEFTEGSGPSTRTHAMVHEAGSTAMLADNAKSYCN
ncbi:hypothetical protein PENTCL1PPCAC_16591, partial [Pristionchus entomophagus]